MKELAIMMLLDLPKCIIRHPIEAWRRRRDIVTGIKVALHFLV